MTVATMVYLCCGCNGQHKQPSHPKDPRPRKQFQGTCPLCRKYTKHHIFERRPITGNWR